MSENATIPRRGGNSRSSFLFLLIGVVAFGYVMLRRGRVEDLVPIVRESRIALVDRLEAAEQIDGFPKHERWVAPWNVAAVNVDDPAIPILLPENGSIAFRDLPIHAGAELRFAACAEFVPPEGMEWAPARIPKGAAHSTIEFTLTATKRTAKQDSKNRRVLTAVQLDLEAGVDLPKRTAYVVKLPVEWAGEHIDLTIDTKTTRSGAAGPVEGEYWLPAIGSPVIASAGEKHRVGELTQHVETTLVDLLEAYQQAIADDSELEWVRSFDDSEIFAIKRVAGREAEKLLIAQRACVPAFDVGGKRDAERYGVEPALLFGLDGTLVRYEFDVPQGRSELRFDIGVDHRSTGVGAAAFRVLIDGQPALERRLEPGATKADAGWHAVAIDLSPHAGQRVKIEFAGRLDSSQSKTMHVREAQPLGPAIEYDLEVKRVQAAFGRPRIVAIADVPRRLAAKKDPARPSVIVVNIETLRARELGCYGGKEDVSPEIDRLALEGVRVDPLISVAPWTAPSVASLLTGLYPYSHGVISYAQTFLADSLDTLGERAQREGVTTAAFVTNDLLSREKNFDQGFETYCAVPYANSRQVVSAFEDWLEDNADLQFFAYLHLFEPHDPCNAPGDDLDRFVPDDLKGRDPRAALGRIFAAIGKGDPPAFDDPDVRLLRGRYLGEIRYADRQIARLRALIEKKNLTGRVVLIVTGDHGEEFCEHGLIGHGSHCFDESVAVPFIAWGPGVVPAGEVIEGPIENTSIFGTVLDLLGVPYDSKRVKPAIRFATGPQSTPAYSSTEQGIRAIEGVTIKTMTVHRLRTKALSFLFSPKGTHAEPSQCAAFDLTSDPFESKDRSQDAGFDLATPKKMLDAAWRFATSESHGLTIDLADPVTAGILRQMGYLAGTRTNAAGALYQNGDDCGPKSKQGK